LKDIFLKGQKHVLPVADVGSDLEVWRRFGEQPVG
jgi:hypothetical protein